MRTQLPVIRYLVLLLALVFSTATVAADSRSEAKAHYQAGVKAYNGGDYRAAIKQFSSAQELFPADLNNYNLALCYDKLGEPEPAIQYYRAFLDKQPTSDKKAEIEASIARLENAAKSAAAKRAAKERDEEAKRAAEAKKAADAAAAKADQPAEARKDKDTKGKGSPDVAPPVTITPDLDEPVGVGSTGTPGGTGTVSTGNAQLDRVQRINVDEIRAQRVGGASSGMPAEAGRPQPAPGTPVPGSNAAANIDVNAHASSGMPATSPPTAAAVPTAQGAPSGTTQGAPDPSDKPKATPVYKKWWFWAVVAVSAYVVISIASEDDNDNNRARMLPEVGGAAAPPSGGMTLMRW